MPCDFDNAIKRHDSLVAHSGLDIWIGSEPTFTLRTSEEKQWLSQPLGGDKISYARRIVQALHLRHPHSIILRTVGRQYDKEKFPRWSFGLYERRNGKPLWHGPPDPMFVNEPDNNQLQPFLAALLSGFEQDQWNYLCLPAVETAEEIRLLIRFDNDDIRNISQDDARLARCSVHEMKTPTSGLCDPLADEGYYLFIIKEITTPDDVASLCVELPDLKTVAMFETCLSVLGLAAKATGLKQLQLQGYPPPVDHSVSWTTITPDPAVIEINQAPQPDIRSFNAASQELFEIAHEQGLSPYRLHYNGNITDSGGGGQFTLGGQTPLSSPFLSVPELLPRLVRYLCLHPSFSYLFATDYVGSASQSPRVDENTRASFRELNIALQQLQAQAECSPENLWASLAPFLADASGNSHRSELNIEKLWNPYLPLRGCLGLLEFRAFRMPYSVERSTAIAMLLRATTAMLAENEVSAHLQDWGDELHDRFALPLFLRNDLKSVFTNLEESGYGLENCIQTELLSNPDRSSWSVDFKKCRLSIEQAIEFWPLVGDTASQESGGSRLVDSSTQRLQISLHPLDDSAPSLADWQLQTSETIIPLRIITEHSAHCGVAALRYRDFTPWRGLHPFVKPSGPITFYLPHLVFEPPEDGSDRYCHVILHQHQQVRLYTGQQTAPPRCPSCRHRIADWKTDADNWLKQPDQSWNCPACDACHSPATLDWRQSVGASQILVEIKNIFPGEAVPVDSLMNTLKALSGEKWRYFYIT